MQEFGLCVNADRYMYVICNTKAFVMGWDGQATQKESLFNSVTSLVLQQLLFPVRHPLIYARRVRHLLPLPERVRRRRRRVLGDAPLLQAVPVAVLKYI